MKDSVNLSDFFYELPEEKIAEFPLKKRDDAKLLVYNDGDIAHSHFYNLSAFLPKNSILVFNNTKVIPARLYFKRETGALIEIFLLQPEIPKLVSLAMQSENNCVWKCMIGNKRKWKKDEVLKESFFIGEILIHITARMVDDEEDFVKISWDSPDFRLVDILEHFGKIPLPPYIKREANEDDNTEYQTVYSDKQGAVASPTAGLHFTEDVFKKLEKKHIKTDFITLHVSGGTFQPIKTENVIDHQMHSEQIIFSRENIENLHANDDFITAVGTTSMRALESLYWFGVKLIDQEKHVQNGEIIPFYIEKLYPYSFGNFALPGLKQSLEAILDYMNRQLLYELIGETRIFIFPGYEFRVCQALISNFHLPNTTLILLVAAFIGEDWRKVYQEALDNDYRFLSYGDSSLFIPKIK